MQEPQIDRHVRLIVRDELKRAVQVQDLPAVAYGRVTGYDVDLVTLMFQFAGTTVATSKVLWDDTVWAYINTYITDNAGAMPPDNFLAIRIGNQWTVFSRPVKGDGTPVIT